MTIKLFFPHTGFTKEQNTELDRLYAAWDILDHAAAYRTYDDVERNQAADEAGRAYDELHAALTEKNATGRQELALADDWDTLEAMQNDLEATQDAACGRW